MEVFLPSESNGNAAHWIVQISCGRKLKGSMQEGMWRAQAPEVTKSFSWSRWGGAAGAATAALSWLGCDGTDCQEHQC